MCNSTFDPSASDDPLPDEQAATVPSMAAITMLANAGDLNLRTIILLGYS